MKGASASRSLLGAKLTPPAALQRHVFRQQVVDEVCAATGVKLVLLRAPAGFGKSTALLQCRERLQSMSVATAWLTLDRADNDASRFLAGLEAVVAAITEDADIEEPGVDLPEGSTVGDLALRLFSRIARQTGAFALFLDDVESIQEAGVLGLLRELIDHLPPNGRLVIASRSLPDLRLGRMRARGQLLEIDAARLRFSIEEAAAFFTIRRAAPLAFEDLSRLHRKTEGWIAALWLASVSLERSESPGDFIDRFSGTEQSVADYLAEDVLARQAPQVRDFLLRTSVLKHLEPSLCDALVPGVDSSRILHELESADVLLVRLGDSAIAYRYHSLFAKFLQDQLSREMPGEARRLHSAAAEWYELQGRPVPAIDHAIEGMQNAHAIALLRAHAGELLAQGRMRLLARWFSALPADALAEHPELQLVHIWSVCFTRGAPEAMDMLERSGLSTSTAPALAPHVRALKPCLLAMMDRYEEAYPVGRRSLQFLPSVVPFADNVLANAMATIVSVMGEHDQARRLIDSARRGQGVNASEFNLMYSEAAEGLIDLQEARLRQATARFRLAVTAVPGRAYSHTSGNAWAGVPYAAALYENDQIDQAAHLLQVYLPLARDVGLPDLVIQGYTTLSRIAFWRGDVDHGLQLLTELEYVGHKGQLPRVVAGAKLERARVQLLQGHHRAARDELDRAGDPALWERVGRLRFLANDLDTMEIARMRWLLHTGDARLAARQLEEAAKFARADARHRRALKLQLLHAAALYRAGDTVAAMQPLREALAAACAEGFVRLVLDEGDILRAPIHALAAQQHSVAKLSGDPVLTDYVRRLAQALGPTAPATPAGASPLGNGPMPDPLTRKEIRVLQLLAEGYSNSAMAEKLFVSDSTIRTHLRNINSKLDAHNRTQAVAMARRLGVIP
ncbi:LuxR C-terminal-related transcriptional regulator [Variovorax sp. PBL-E5]|uniref:LuxR C-terminal-related transcriptional regulator n=1 Tax=Variovorax sp. PBL-E5 TaxID=434014 RepID=UPI001316D377|nr:LuxR C-terminal-related transcriptional regulator [Variovorax sp. PBL-E5]VTU39949.1 ATP-dependent transcriptional activator MalT [Variovorax sp. PBL-E5]